MKYNKSPISLREGKVFIDGVEVMDGIKANIKFTPDVWTGKQLGEKTPSSRYPPKGKKATEVNKGNIISFAKGQVDEEVRLKMQAPKSTVLQLYTAYVPVDTKKSVALEAANYVIDMIYTKTIREDEGGTYGVGTSMVAQRAPEERLVCQVYFNTNPESVEKLSALAVKGLKELAENGPSQEHFNMAVENFKKNVPESRITNNYWMKCLEIWNQFGIDQDTEYEAALNALTPEDVKAALQELLSQGNVINISSFPAE